MRSFMELAEEYEVEIWSQQDGIRQDKKKQ
jgi:hypothetical protein